MSQKPNASTSWVHLLQALASREAVEQMGLSARRVSELLDLAPSAVSQYLSGKRVERGFLAYAADERARTIARRVIESLIEANEAGESPAPLVLQGAIALSTLAQPAPRSGHSPTTPASTAVPLRSLAKWLRRRVRAEQVAVSQCMRLAQHARDELTRALLRQIASDSLRHAEIVASLAPYIDRGVSSAYVSGISRSEVEALIEGERRAEHGADSELVRHLKGTMSILVASMEADERKHAELLRDILSFGFRS